MPIEGLQKKEQQNKIISTAQELRDKLEKQLFITCLEFERETGLMITGIVPLRAHVEGYDGRRVESVLHDINVQIEL